MGHATVHCTAVERMLTQCQFQTLNGTGLRCGNVLSGNACRDLVG